jgi:hypothetical protein
MCIAFVARVTNNFWRVAEWLVRKTLVPKVEAARVVQVAASLEVEAAAWAAVDLPAARVEAEDAPVVAVVDKVVAVAVDAQAAVVVDRVVVDRVVVDKAGAAVVVPVVAEADKVAEVADVPVVGAEARVVVVEEAASPAVALVAGKAAVEWEAEEVAVVVPVELGAEEIASLLFHTGRRVGAPSFFPRLSELQLNGMRVPRYWLRVIGVVNRKPVTSNRQPASRSVAFVLCYRKP